jgi:hypothetical protein
MHFVEICCYNQGPMRFNLDFIAHIDFVVYPESKSEPEILTIISSSGKNWDFYQKTDYNTNQVENKNWDLRLLNNLSQVYSNLLKAIEAVQKGHKFNGIINLCNTWDNRLII